VHKLTGIETAVKHDLYGFAVLFICTVWILSLDSWHNGWSAFSHKSLRGSRKDDVQWVTWTQSCLWLWELLRRHLPLHQWMFSDCWVNIPCHFLTCGDRMVYTIWSDVQVHSRLLILVSHWLEVSASTLPVGCLGCYEWHHDVLQSSPMVLLGDTAQHAVTLEMKAC